MERKLRLLMILPPYKLLLLILIIFPPIILFSQEKITYQIEGNKLFGDQFYTDLIQDLKPVSIEEANEVIIPSLNNEGIYLGRVLEFKIDTLSKTVYLQIDEGNLTSIRSVNIDSLTFNDSLFVSKEVQYLIGGVFVQSEVETMLSNLLIEYEEIGYPFAEIEVKSIKFNLDQDSNSVVDIYLEVNKGKIRKIDKVEIIGNSKTKDYVILNAIRLEKGEIYSQKRLNNIPILLNKLRFFTDIKSPTYYLNSKDEGILKIELHEKNTNSFDGILGYVPSNDKDESGYFTGFVNIGLRNLFGTGRGLAFKWQQENSLTQELEIDYLEPWLISQPINLRLRFFQRKQDSSYVKRILGGNLEYLATENISASVLFESESIIPALNSSSALILNSSSLNTGLQFRLDYRDDLYAPTTGSYFESTYRYKVKNISKSEGQENLTDDSELDYHIYELDFGLYYSLFSNQVLALGIHAKELLGDYFDLSDYFQLGGTNSLRGYREKQFLGNRIIWSNLEYRFMLSQLSYVFAFYDAGYYLLNNTETDIKISDFKNGYGLGISLDTTLGIMKVSYAFSDGSSITNGLIHFGLLNDF